MRKAILFLSMLLATAALLSGCAVAEPPAPRPPVDPTDGEMMRAMDRWVVAFNAHSPADLAALYAEDAYILAGPRSRKPETVRRYLDAVRRHPEQSAQWVGSWSYNHEESDHVAIADRDIQLTETVTANRSAGTFALRWFSRIAEASGRSWLTS